MEKINVLIVDDSAVVRLQIASLLSGCEDIQVVGEARNGREAVELASKLSPHIITMDLYMPVMDGLEATEEIMATRAIPILMVSDADESDTAFKAISAGALAIFPKADLSEEKEEEFVQKIRFLSRASVIKHLRKTRKHSPLPLAEPPSCKVKGVGTEDKVIAIASSTGGPKALSIILAQLPETFPYPIVIAQHIADGFVSGLANWLNTMSKLTIKVAEEGESLNAGTVYLSLPDMNLVVKGDKTLSYLSLNKDDIYHPSCNKLLSSAAEAYGRNAIGIILTGMGDDGVRGLEKIKKCGGRTLAQDKDSCVVFGMPRVAIESGASEKTISLKDMAVEICRLAYRHSISSPFKAVGE